MIVPMRAEHVKAVFADLSDQTVAEAQEAGLTVNELSTRFCEFLRGGDYLAHAFLDDDRPYCIMATRRHGVHPTFLVAGKGFFERSLRHRHDFRRYLAQLVDALGGPIMTVSDSPHPAAPRWFKLMGYLEMVPRKVYRWG